MAPFTVAANKVSTASTIAAVSSEGISSFPHHSHRVPLGPLCPRLKVAYMDCWKTAQSPRPALHPALRPAFKVRREPCGVRQSSRLWRQRGAGKGMEVSFAELVCEGYLRPPIDPILGLGVPSKPI